jgi:hypothetical protein
MGYVSALRAQVPYRDMYSLRWTFVSLAHASVEAASTSPASSGMRIARSSTRVADPFLAFHYRFVTPNLTALETAPPWEFYEALIAPYLDEYTSGPFEEMAREYVRRYGREVLPSRLLCVRLAVPF